MIQDSGKGCLAPTVLGVLGELGGPAPMAVRRNRRYEGRTGPKVGAHNL